MKREAASPKQQTTLEQRVTGFIKKHRLFSPSEALLVAVSGGADSVCLLHLLAQQQAVLGAKLHIAHLNHKLRGDESDEDAWYVVGLAHKLGIPVIMDTRDVAAYRDQRRCSMEEAAREVRYGFLAEAATRVGAGCVAVGHTRDDQVETVLMHVLRGTGIAGLRGLQPKSVLLAGEGKSPLTVVRPLLEVLRYETVDYCRRHNLEPRSDSSNASIAFLRNRVRLELLPALREYNPRFDAALVRLAEIAAVELAYLDEQAARLWPKVSRVETSAVYLDKARLLRLSPVLQRHLLRRAAEQLLGNLRDIEADHVETMVNFLSKLAGKSLHLPHGLRLSVEYGRLVLALHETASCPFPPLESEAALNVPGVTILPGWKVRTEVVTGTTAASSNESNRFIACFDLKKAGTSLLLRGRRRGDRFQPLGMRQAKKLQDFMVDARIPRSWRSRVPLLCSPQQILWVVGWRVDDRVKVIPATKKVLKVTLERTADGCGCGA